MLFEQAKRDKRTEELKAQIDQLLKDVSCDACLYFLIEKIVDLEFRLENIENNLSMLEDRIADIEYDAL